MRVLKTHRMTKLVQVYLIAISPRLHIDRPVHQPALRRESIICNGQRRPTAHAAHIRATDIDHGLARHFDQDYARNSFILRRNLPEIIALHLRVRPVSRHIEIRPLDRADPPFPRRNRSRSPASQRLSSHSTAAHRYRDRPKQPCNQKLSPSHSPLVGTYQ